MSLFLAVRAASAGDGLCHCLQEVRDFASASFGVSPRAAVREFPDEIGELLHRADLLDFGAPRYAGHIVAYYFVFWNRRLTYMYCLGLMYVEGMDWASGKR